MKHKAISYLRYSSKGQARGDSERRQEESFTRWLLQNADKYIAYEPFRDLGKSGFSGGHLASGGSLGRLLQQAKDGLFEEGDLLVVEAIDRLTRLEPLDAIDLFKDILKTGLSILTLEDNQIYSTESVNSGGIALINLVIKSQASHEYSKRLGARIKSAHEKKRANAEVGEANKVVGAAWLKNGKLFEPIANLVRHAINMYLNGYGTRAIAIEITSKIKDCDAEVQRKYKKPISARTIKRWLDNPALIGNWKSKYKLIEGCFEPLIDYSTWMKVQNQLEFRKANKIVAGTVKHYKISGLVRCHHCGSPFTVRVQKPRPSKAAPFGSVEYESKLPIRYLNCSKYLKSGGCENNSTWPYQALDYIYERTINECLFQIAMELPISKEYENKINDLTESISRGEEKLIRVRRLYIDFGDEKSEIEFLQLQNEIKNFREQREVLILSNNKSRRNDGGEFLTDVDSVITCEPWEIADEVGRRKILKDADYSIIIDGKNAECWYSDVRWKLIKRNQNSRTYTLEEIQESDQSENKFIAIDDEGHIMATANNLRDLSNLLDGETDQVKQH